MRLVVIAFVLTFVNCKDCDKLPTLAELTCRDNEMKCELPDRAGCEGKARCQRKPRPPCKAFCDTQCGEKDFKCSGGKDKNGCLLKPATCKPIKAVCEKCCRNTFRDDSPAACGCPENEHLCLGTIKNGCATFAFCLPSAVKCPDFTPM